MDDARDTRDDRRLQTPHRRTESEGGAVFEPDRIARAARCVRDPVHIIRDRQTRRLGLAPAAADDSEGVPSSLARSPSLARLGTLPELYPEWLGDRTFNDRHGVRFPYVAGAMANGISSPELVVEMGRAGMLGIFGAAGLDLDQIEAGLDAIDRSLQRGESWGANLIHAPNEPNFEARLAELFVERDVRCATASSYIDPTPAVVHYACSGLRTTSSGEIVRPNRLIAKVSRPEVAEKFTSPPDGSVLEKLRRDGRLSARECELARHVPLAEDITAEADSGGHTDGRAMPVLLPGIREVARRARDASDVDRPIRVGAAGGLGTPRAVASAFALGADYVVTGSVNQGAVESGLSEEGRRLLAEADATETELAPSADRFEHGAEVQVLARGTMFAHRANRLGRLYRQYESLEDLPEDDRDFLEEDIFGAPLEEVWRETRRYWEERAPSEAERARRDPRRRMALVFRRYLGRSSMWASRGTSERRGDYQIWCGPAMGAFNRWVDGSFLAEPDRRTVVQIARNLLEGATVVTRAHQLRTYGVPVPPATGDFPPRRLE